MNKKNNRNKIKNYLNKKNSLRQLYFCIAIYLFYLKSYIKSNKE